MLLGMAGVGSPRIIETGVVCLECDWRNPGTSATCSNCRADLITTRPDQSEAWVGAQLEARTRLGLPIDTETVEVLTDWAFLGGYVHEVVDDEQPPTDRTPPVTADPEPIVNVLAVACTSCDTTFTKPVAFCSACGSPTQEIEPTLSEIVEALQRLDSQIVTLREAVVRLERREGKGRRPANFSWVKVPSSEKWSVTWGVFGRSILINLAIYVGLMLLLAALVGLGSLPG